MIGLAQEPGYKGLKALLIASTGLAFYADRDEPLTELIGGRMSKLGLRTCVEYAGLLADSEKGPAEMEVLIARLTIGETFFFRHEEQFAAIRDIILPEILDRNQLSRQLRIWSAGCANGAEPYSIAILLMRHLASRIAGWHVHILATDLNSTDLTQASEGRYRAWALRSTPDEIRRDCFSYDASTWILKPKYKRWVSFQHMNLVETEFPNPLIPSSSFDLILCRNVMIYFAPDVSLRMVGHFQQSLGEKGWLVVGPSEHNMENYTGFREVNAEGAKVYQKSSLPQTQSDTPSSDTPNVVASMSPLAAAPTPPADSGSDDMDVLRGLADSGDWRPGAEHCRRMLRDNALTPEVFFYQALILENLGIVDEPEQSLRRAIYLNRRFALAHYHLGLILQRERQQRAAALSFCNVLKALSGMPDYEIVTSGRGVTVAALRALAETRLENANGSTPGVNS